MEAQFWLAVLDEVQPTDQQLHLLVAAAKQVKIAAAVDAAGSGFDQAVL